MFKNSLTGLSATHSSAIIIVDLVSTCTFKIVLTLSFDSATGYIVKTIMRNTIKANKAHAELQQLGLVIVIVGLLHVSCHP